MTLVTTLISTEVAETVGELRSSDSVVGVTGGTAGTAISGDTYGSGTWGATLTNANVE